MSSTRTAETVWCPTCRVEVVAMVDRYLKGTSMARCPWCESIIHPRPKP